jgi:hypothetical protein
LDQGDKISFYVVAIDNVGNIAETYIYNETIEITPKMFSSTIPVLFLDDDSSTIIHFDLETETNGYLWFETDDSFEVEVLGSDFTLTNLIDEEKYHIYEVTKQSTETIAVLSILGNTSIEGISIHWCDVIDLLTSQINTYEYTLTTYEGQQTYLVNVEITEEGKLSLRLLSTQLIPNVYVFDSNWNLVDILTPAHSVSLTSGSYFFWIKRVYREGQFGLYFGEDEYSYTDPYYTDPGWNPVSPGFTWVSVVAAIGVLSLIVLYTTRRKKQRK